MESIAAASARNASYVRRQRKREEFCYALLRSAVCTEERVLGSRKKASPIRGREGWAGLGCGLAGRTLGKVEKGLTCPCMPCPLYIPEEESMACDCADDDRLSHSPFIPSLPRYL